MVVTSLSIDEYGKWPTRLAQNAIGADLDFIKPDILNQIKGFVKVVIRFRTSIFPTLACFEKKNVRTDNYFFKQNGSHI